MTKTEAKGILSSLACDETALRSVRLEAIRLYAEIEGWIGQPPATKAPPKTQSKEKSDG